MSDSLENLNRRKESAADLGSVVRTMKAMAAANIGQYEMAVSSLQDYYKNISLGIYAVFSGQKKKMDMDARFFQQVAGATATAIVFGSDQGLVGRFNETLAAYLQQVLDPLPGKKEVWVVGERMVPVLSEAGYPVKNVFAVPGTVGSISRLTGEISVRVGQCWEQGEPRSLYLFYNAPEKAASYLPVHQQLLPLGINWKQEFASVSWPGKLLPEIIGPPRKVLLALVNEYLFISLYSAFAGSLASENASRLAAMQRAEKNIDEMLEELDLTYNRLRQSAIDEELFDVMAGFEVLKLHR